MRSVIVQPPASPFEVDEWLAQLLGSASCPDADVLLHVCSCWQDEGGALRAIRIGEAAPSGPTDAFMLRVARAQADAIVTSGRILRHEPALDHELGKDRLGSLLRAYRARVLQRRAPPRTLVVSRSGALPARHPLWEDWSEVTVWTGPEQVDRLRASLPSRVVVVGSASDGLEPAFEFLREGGARRISLEMGPRAMAGLYAEGQVRELWCSRFEGTLAVPARGAAWPFDAATLRSWACGQGSQVDEASGRWRFGRHCPTPAG